MNSCDKQQLKITAAKVRLGIIEGVYNAKSGHPGGSLSAADIFTYLYFKELHIDPQNPKDPDRDRFVLSKGHCAPGLSLHRRTDRLSFLPPERKQLPFSSLYRRTAGGTSGSGFDRR